MLFYVFIGALLVFIQFTVIKALEKKNKAKLWPNCVLVLLANVSIIFSIAWAYASMLENEVQAAMMGLLMFGGMGLIFAIIAYRVITSPDKINSNKTTQDA